MQQREYEKASVEQLVVAALVGGLQAYDELVRRFRTKVLFAAEQITRSRSVAEEVAQEAFLLAFHALPDLEEPNAFGAWVVIIARNRARRVVRRETRTEAMSDTALAVYTDANAAHDTSRDPARVLQHRVEQEGITDALRGVSEEMRTCLILYYREQWSLAQIAAHQNITTTAVKGRLHRGRQQLRRALSPDYDLERTNP